MGHTRVLVTGVAGFIGARVAELLLDAGIGVAGFDNMSDAYDVRLKRWRLERLLGREGFSWSPVDIVDRAALRQAFSELSPTPSAVIHLAARAGVRASVRDPWAYVDSNVTGTLNILDLAKGAAAKFVLASSSSLYGRANAAPHREDANTDSPLSPYAATKKAAEALCHSYHHLHGVDVTVLRYFTVYGPAGRPDMSPLRFVQWIVEGRPVRLHGDGEQSRDFTYIDDIAAGTVSALRPLGWGVINLGSDKPVRILELIERIERLTGKSAALELGPADPSDVPITWADITKAGELLGWRPGTGFEEGLSRLVGWYLENRSWAREIQTV